MSEQPAVATYYERVGGNAAVTGVVDQFYDRVLADPELVAYFDGVDVGHVKRHQVLLISSVLRGPVPTASTARTHFPLLYLFTLINAISRYAAGRNWRTSVVTADGTGPASRANTSSAWKRDSATPPTPPAPS